MGIEVDVEVDYCIGAGLCVKAYAEVFGQNPDDGLVVVKRTDYTDADLAGLRQAERQCPARAIAVREAASA